MGEILSFENAVNSNNKRAEKMNAIGQLTVEEFETAYLYFGGKCVYSGKPIDTKLSIEHIIPIMSGGHSLAFNCVPVIKKYNEQKSGFHLLDWWRMQTGENGKSLYNPHRLLKLINYMVKSLEAINTGNETTHVLIDNEIDKFLNDNLDLLNKDFSLPYKKPTYKNISKIETYMRMEMSQEEYIDKMYDELDRFKLNVAIFFEEAIYELSKDIPMEVIEELKQKISNIPNIYMDGKKIFKKEMNEKDIAVRKAVIHWAEDEKIDNKYGIVGYMDFEVLKKQEDIVAFLDSRKQKVLELLGANEKDFNNIVNKIPNILTDLDVENRINDLVEGLKINTNKVEGKSSELYRYVTNKPDLLLSGENMNILLQYARKYDIDKRIFKKGIPITTILDNLEVAIDVVKKANFGYGFPHPTYKSTLNTLSWSWGTKMKLQDFVEKSTSYNEADGYDRAYALYCLDGVPATNVSAFGGIRKLLAIREKFRIACESTVTQETLLTKIDSSNYQSKHTIALSTWYVDIHNQNYSCVSNIPNGVPYEALIPKCYTNSLVACRAYGASHIALSSIRLVKTMMDLGHSAGIAIKQLCYSDTRGDVRTVDVSSVQNEIGILSVINDLETHFFGSTVTTE